MLTLYSGKVSGRGRQLKTQGTGRWLTDSLLVAQSYSSLVSTWEFDDTNARCLLVPMNGESWSFATDSIAREHNSDYDCILFKDMQDVGPRFLELVHKGIAKRERLVADTAKQFISNVYVINNTSLLRKVKQEVMSSKELIMSANGNSSEMLFDLVNEDPDLARQVANEIYKEFDIDSRNDFNNIYEVTDEDIYFIIENSSKSTIISLAESLIKYISEEDARRVVEILDLESVTSSTHIKLDAYSDLYLSQADAYLVDNGWIQVPLTITGYDTEYSSTIQYHCNSCNRNIVLSSDNYTRVQFIELYDENRNILKSIEDPSLNELVQITNS